MKKFPILLLALIFLFCTEAELNREVKKLQIKDRRCLYGDCQNGYGVRLFKEDGSQFYLGTFENGKYHGVGVLVQKMRKGKREKGGRYL